jgi:hypothetical protein
VLSCKKSPNFDQLSSNFLEAINVDTGNHYKNSNFMVNSDSEKMAGGYNDNQ